MTTLHSSPAEAADTPWHALPADEALARHGVEANQGLTEEEAAARLLRHGPTACARRPAAAHWLAS